MICDLLLVIIVLDIDLGPLSIFGDKCVDTKEIDSSRYQWAPALFSALSLLAI